MKMVICALLVGRRVYEQKNDTWNIMENSSTGFTNSIDNIYGNYGCKMSFHCDVYSDINKSSIFFKYSDDFQNPYIMNTADDLSTGKFDYLLINFGSLSKDDNIGIRIYEIGEEKVYTDDSGYSTSYHPYTFLYGENKSQSKIISNSYIHSLDDEFWIEIPQDDFGINWTNNKTYKIYLDNGKFIYDDDFIEFVNIQFTIGGLTAEDIANNQTNALINSNKETQLAIDQQTDAINNQTEAIKENNETNKNIFQKIGDILSFINPFSENFFGRKLVELIIDGLKALFIPEDGFFSSYFDEIRQWFSDRFGFLWAPFDFFIELLTRILNINFSEPKFIIPDIYEPFTNNKIVSSTEFNFNDLLLNNIIKTVHDIYLLLVDGFIILSLYKLTREKIEEVFTK